MTKRDESMDERLGRLARETERVGPRPGFDLRVMAAIGAEVAARMEPGWIAGVISTSRRALFAAALAAVVGVLLATTGARSTDEELAADYTAVGMEIEW